MTNEEFLDYMKRTQSPQVIERYFELKEQALFPNDVNRHLLLTQARETCPKDIGSAVKEQKRLLPTNS